MDDGGKSIRDFKGKTYLPNGDINTISKSDINKKTIAKEWGRKYVEWSIAFPGLENGAIIEYSYERTFRRLDGIYKWVFSHEVPTLFSRVQILPKIQSPWAYYSQNPSGKADVLEKDKEITFTRKNIPPFIEEPFGLPTTSTSDAIVFYYFSVVKSPENYWEEWGDEIYRSFIEFTEPCRKSKKLVKENFEHIPPEAKLRAIYDFVQTQYLPYQTLTEDEKESYKKEIHKMRYGGNSMPTLLSLKVLHSFEMYQVLACLIQTAIPNCSIDMIFYSPWDTNVFNSKILSTDQLSGFILRATVNNQPEFLEIDRRYRPFGAFDHGAKMNTALVCTAKGSGFETILGERCTKNKTLKESFVTITEDGRAHIRSHIEADPYESYRLRSVIIHMEKDDQKEFLNTLLPKDDQLEVELETWSFENLNDLDKALVLDVTYSYPIELKEVGDYIFLGLQGIDIIKENPFTNETRNGVIVFNYPKYLKHLIHIQIPDHLALSSIPQDHKINQKDFIYTMRFKEGSKNELLVKIEKVLEGNVFPPGKNQFFFESYANMMRAQNEKLVLTEL